MEFIRCDCEFVLSLLLAPLLLLDAEKCLSVAAKAAAAFAVALNKAAAVAVA